MRNRESIPEEGSGEIAVFTKSGQDQVWKLARQRVGIRGSSAFRSIDSNATSSSLLVYL